MSHTTDKVIEELNKQKDSGENCPKCNTKMFLQDESFDHPFGCERIVYLVCPNCNYAESEEGIEMPDIDDTNETPRKN